MKWRNRKKAFECAHLHHEHDWMTDDPYDIYWDYDWCGVKRFGFGTKESPEENDPCWNGHYPCESCKKFKLSKAMIRKEREIQKNIKHDEKYWKKLHMFFIGKSDSEIEDLVETINVLLKMQIYKNPFYCNPIYFNCHKHLLDEYKEYCKFAKRII